MDGLEHSATDLAVHAGVTAQTASSHLARLVDARILRRRRVGRRRYYALAASAVAEAIEALEEVITARDGRSSPATSSLRSARLCYDHLAGRLGVALTSSLRRRRYLRARGGDFEVTGSGRDFFGALGVDVERAEARRRLFARRCLDSTERESHLGGALGAALAGRFLSRGWVRRIPGTRAVAVTPSGRRVLRSRFDIAGWDRSAARGRAPRTPA